MVLVEQMVRVPTDTDAQHSLLCTGQKVALCHISVEQSNVCQNDALAVRELRLILTCLLLVHSTQLTLSLLRVRFFGDSASADIVVK